MRPKYCSKQIRLTSLAMAIAAAGFANAGTEESTMAPAMEKASTADWLEASGYAAVSYGYTDIELDNLGGITDDSFFDEGTPLDAVKLGLKATEGAFSAYASLFYSPVEGNDAFGSGNDAGILDAYGSYSTGAFTLTAGKYLSWLGYEAFDTVNMNQITYANGLLGAVPGYHTGIKGEYSTDTFGAGINVSDSIRGGDTFWSGDEDFSNGLGYEAYVTYKGIDRLTLWAGLAIDNSDEIEGKVFDDLETYNLWASYALTDKLTAAAEIIYSDQGATDGIQSLALLQYAFTDKFSTVFRVGLDEVSDYDHSDVIPGLVDDSMEITATVAPSYKVNDNLTVRAELTYGELDYGSTIGDGNGLFAGAQAVLKF